MFSYRQIAFAVVAIVVVVIGYNIYSSLLDDSPSQSPSNAKINSKSSKSEKQEDIKQKEIDKPQQEDNDIKEDKKENIIVDEIDEGVIKYECHWTESKPFPQKSISSLLDARNKLYDLGLIGVYTSNGIGFGNISQKIDDNNNNNNCVSFYITGTQTSKIDNLSMNSSHFSMVNNYDISLNQLYCIGAIRASSESMTHATIYELNENIRSVVHIHNNAFWNKCINILPTTNKNVKYGTPDMANEVIRLYNDSKNDLQNQKIFVMGGHQDGIVSFGDSIQNAMDLMINTYNQYCNSDDDVKDNNNNNNNNDTESPTSTRSTESVTASATASSDNQQQGLAHIPIIATHFTPTTNPQEPKNNGFVQIPDSDNLKLNP